MIDTVREGKAPAVIRLKGAEGLLPVPPVEKYEILAILASDADEQIRSTAQETLKAAPADEIRQVFADPATPASLLEFGADHLAPTRADVVEALLMNPQLPIEFLSRLQQVEAPPPEPASAATPATVPNGEPAATGAEPTSPEESSEGGKRTTLLQRINAMTPSQKIKMALTGNMEERLILIRDSNKLVSRAVLGSPKLSDQEVENFASMKNVSEEVLRLIAMNRKFAKSYAVVRQLVNNPRTPIDVGLPLLNRLNDRDMKGIMINKNVPEVIRSMAIRLVKQKEEASKPKIGAKH